jgi:hypothetical protein
MSVWYRDITAVLPQIGYMHGDRVIFQAFESRRVHWRAIIPRRWSPVLDIAFAWDRDQSTLESRIIEQTSMEAVTDKHMHRPLRIRLGTPGRCE